MKTLKLIIIVILLTNFSSAQVTQIVPHNTIIEYSQNGIYYKDLNNEMAQYIGIWNAILNNKKYTFEFIKFTQEYYKFDEVGGFYYMDRLKIKFKVVDLVTNAVLYDDTNISNSEDFKINGSSLKTGGYFYKDEINCNIDVRFKMLKIPNYSNQLKYCYFEYYWHNTDGCPYPDTISIPMFLPKEDLIFTKQ